METMAAHDETPPPRHRRRAYLPDTVEMMEDLLRDVATRVLHEELPEDLADRLRVLVSRRDPYVMEWLYDTMYMLRLAGLTHIVIADRFQVHVVTVSKWWKLAQVWAKNKHTSLDPARHFAGRMQLYDLQERRATTMMLNTDDAKEMAQLMAVMARIDVNRRTWLEKHDYFKLFPFGKLAGGQADDAARAKEFTEDLRWAFGEDSGRADMGEGIADLPSVEDDDD